MDIERQIESLQARVDAGDAEATKELASSLDFQARMDSYYWTISADSLNWYRAHDDQVMLSVSGELDEIQAGELFFDAAENGIRPDELIAAIEKKAQMRRLEK
ncbi:MAG: hypothetical protein IJ048_09330, partial [Clostridia bacterium]|nr:hypothetical protein [Clostridia bacterium]